jgi:hypothetical protein
MLLRIEVYIQNYKYTKRNTLGKKEKGVLAVMKAIREIIIVVTQL